jgi:SdrD B-like domain
MDGSGTLALQNIELEDGSTSGSGGGIDQSSGVTELNDVTVTDNIAGPTGAGDPNYKPSEGGGDPNGGNGGDGANGYGGGIYLSGGTLVFNSGTSVTSNTVQAQNGGHGQSGAVELSQPYAGNGGDGGNGGNAYGGGIYQQGGTLQINNLSASSVTSNVDKPGSGGDGAVGGEDFYYDPYLNVKYGAEGENGKPGTGVANYDNAAGCTVLAVSNAIDSAVPDTSSAAGGMYSSGGSLASSDAADATASSVNGVGGIVLDLFSADGTLIAQTSTNSDGRYNFNTPWSGLGYIQVSVPPTFQLAPLGTPMDANHASGIDPASGRSGVVPFLDGVPINQGVDIVLRPIPTSFLVGNRAVALRDDSTDSLLWKAPLMPGSYTGGFVLTRFDVNDDGTPDDVMATKAGQTIVFIVDGRTGAITRIRGSVDPAFRHKFNIQSGDFAGGGGTQLLFNEASGPTGALMLIDLKTDRVVWSVRRPLPGKLSYQQVPASEPGRAGLSDIYIRSLTFPKDTLLLNAQTGKIVSMHEPNRSSVVSRLDRSQSRLDHGHAESSRIEQERPRASIAVVRTSRTQEGARRQIGKSVPRVSFASRRRPLR